MIELTDTTSSDIAAEFVRARRRAGSPAMGMVMTLVFVVDQEAAEAAMEVARAASREHPARVLGLILGDGRGAGQVDAKVGIGNSKWEASLGGAVSVGNDPGFEYSRPDSTGPGLAADPELRLNWGVKYRVEAGFNVGF